MNVQYVGKVKSCSLAYNRRETRDKRPLGRVPDRGWCHLHIGVKLFWSQLMAPYECAATQSMDPWAATKKALHQLLSGSLPNGRLSQISRRLGQELFTLSI